MARRSSGSHFSLDEESGSSSHHASDSFGSSSSMDGSPCSSSGSASLPPAAVIDIFGHPLPDEDALARLPETFVRPSYDEIDSSAGPYSIPRTSLVVEDYDFSSAEDDEAAGESRRMLRAGSLSDEMQSYSSHLGSRAPSPVPSSPGGFWGQTLSRKGSRVNLTEKGPVEEREYAVPDSDYFNSHHYRTSPLAQKLGLPRDKPLLDLPPKRNGRKKWFSRQGKRKGSVLLLSPNGSTDHLPSKLQFRGWRCCNPIPECLLRQAWCPTRPFFVLLALALIAAFVFSVTTFLINALDTDKEPLPWRTYCQEERAFPHDFADSLDPVTVFVGVFSTDNSYERRHLIRSTYARHSRPVDHLTGKPANNVQVKFILGKPRAQHARRVALEMETFNDVVVLDVKENMNHGKTHAFFSWANENATVPLYYRQVEEPPVKKGVNGIGGLHQMQGNNEVVKIGVGFKKADFVVKADDDSFIVLSELERHLRVAPREKTYWGYLIRNLFMGGECYALSSDLVNFVATDANVLNYLKGAEDKRVAKWMRIHPEANTINWVTERCWIYDHPKAGTTYSHGFLFPDEVKRVREEGRRGLTAEEISARGGEPIAPTYSTVAEWKKAYTTPLKGMTMEEEVEALVEGGGRFSDGWKSRVATEALVPWSKVVFSAGDERLRNSVAMASGESRSRLAQPLNKGSSGAEWTPTVKDHYKETSLKFGRPPSELITELPDLDSLLQSKLKDALTASEGAEQASGTTSGDAPTPLPLLSLVSDVSQPADLLVPPPSLRYDPTALAVRQRRFLGLPYGGTVVVHFLKRDEWFLETALILLGRARTWDAGITPAVYDSAPGYSVAGLSSGLELLDGERTTKIEVSNQPQWGTGESVREVEGNLFGGARMYGSPIVDDDGYVREGRPVPQSKEEEVAMWKGESTEPGQTSGWVRGRPRLRVGDPEEGPRFPPVPAAEGEGERSEASALAVALGGDVGAVPLEANEATSVSTSSMAASATVSLTSPSTRSVIKNLSATKKVLSNKNISPTIGEGAQTPLFGPFFLPSSSSEDKMT